MTKIALALICSLLAVLGGAPASAQDYPNRLIKLVVGFPAGSFTDVVGRAFADKASRILGQTIIVENKPGVNGVLASKGIMAAEPDGYTFMLNSNSHAANASLFKTPPYDPVADFAPLARLVGIPLVLMVRPGLDVKNVAELIALAKKEPGKLKFGSGNTSSRAGPELMKMMAGIDLQYIPYRGMPQAVTDLISGQVDLIITDTSFLMGQGPNGPLKALAVTTSQRIQALPDVPTFAESGLPGFELVGWLGAFAPPKTPPAIVQKLNKVLIEVLNDTAIKDILAKLGTYSSPSSPEELAKFVAAETDKWARIHQAAGIEKQ
jgi:tripartite-type tricarboxylate transporter receptor subunit TctC